MKGPVPAQLQRVVDGDTVRVIAEIWLDQTIEVSVRIPGIDAPELYRPKCLAEKSKARAAKKFVQGFLGEGRVWLHDIERGKYAGRVVAHITNEAGQNLAEALVNAEHAINGKRGAWC